MMVVPVFITSCHVSEKSNKGPLTAQMTITANAIIHAIGLPVAFVTLEQNILKNLVIFFHETIFIG